MRAGASIGRTIVALVVVLVIFLVIALFVLIGTGTSSGEGIASHPAVAADVAAAKEDFPHVSGTAAEHVRRAQELGVEGSELALQEALREYRKALALDDESLDAYMGIAGLAVELERAGADFDVHRALGYCDAVEDHYPGEPRPCGGRARIATSLTGYAAGASAWAAVRERYPDDSEALLQSGRCLLELGRHEEASARLRQRIAQGGDATEPLLLLAENHRRANELGVALRILTQVPAEGWRGAQAAVAMADIFVQAGDEASAREQVRVALRFDGNHSEALLRDAVYRYQDEKQLDVARENLLRLLEQPDIDETPELRDAAALHLGTIYRLSGDAGRAHRYLDPLVVLHPDDIEVRFQVAKLSLVDGSVGDVVGPFGTLLAEHDCADPQPWLLCGQLHLHVGDLEQAIESFHRAIELDAGYAPAHFALIHVLSQFDNRDDIRWMVNRLYDHAEQQPLTGQRDRRYHDPFDYAILAESVSNTVLLLEDEYPGDPVSVLLQVLHPIQLGDRQAADPILEELATTRRGEPIHRLHQGKLALAAGRVDLASEYFADAAEQAPTRALYLYLAGRMLEEEARGERAEDLYERLDEYHPGHVLALHGMARQRHRLGDIDGARALYTRANEADGDFLPAWRDHLLLELDRRLRPGVL